VFSTQFVSSTAITMLSSVLVVRFEATRVLAAGFGLMAVGVGTLGIAGWPWGLLATAAYGAGLGLVLPTTNFLVAAANPNRESSAVSLVNVSWGVGAVAWPLVVTALGDGDRIIRPTGFLSLLLALTLVRLTWLRAQQQVSRREAPAATHERDQPVIPAAASIVVVFGALLFSYSGTESAIGGWIAEHVRRLSPASNRWTLAPTLFWAALSTGRLLTPAWLRGATERAVVMAGLAVAAAAITALLLVPSAAFAYAAAACAGLGLAPVFPISLTAMSLAIAPSNPRLLGPLFALTGVGSAVLPWTMGVVSTGTHSLRAAFVVPLAGCAAMAALSIVRLRQPAAATV
jgi:fucose permease